jgi:phosphoribosylformylglycinamidine synthase
VPKVNPTEGKDVMDKLSEAISRGLVQACHDCSEGGIGVAAAEMAFAGGYGMNLYMKDVPRSDDVDRNDVALFSESNSRFVVEVSREFREEFERIMAGTATSAIGEIVDGGDFKVYGLEGDPIVSANIRDLKEVWQKTFRW